MGKRKGPPIRRQSGPAESGTGRICGCAGEGRLDAAGDGSAGYRGPRPPAQELPAVDPAGRRDFGGGHSDWSGSLPGMV